MASRGGDLRVQAALATEIERHLHAAGGVDDLTASVSAGMISAALFAALTTWGRRGADLEELGPIVEKALAAAESGVNGVLYT